MRVTTRKVDAAAEQRLLAAGVAPLLARLYAARGVDSISQLDQGLERLLEPMSLTHAIDAARRLATAIEQHQHVLIIADYDCDGATACAVAVRGLRALGAHVDYLVPNRFETGYGLTPEIVDIAAARFAPDLLVTVDNGVASVAGAARAHELGIDLIITDHHLPGPALPRAAVIVNPNQHGCSFASKNLAGVGVMFYVLLALRREMRERGHFEHQPEPKLDGLLDLVALGTVADVVRLDSNNRLLVQAGLKRIRAGRMQPGMNALFRVAQREPKSASANDFGFALAPRINAAGRLADMSLGIACLVTDDALLAESLAQRLSALNDERRSIEAKMQEDALGALASLHTHAGLAEQSAICVFDANWHQGVVGILAGRLKERFHRPALAFAPIEGGRWRGSGRSIEGVHLRDVLDLMVKRQPALILQFGGHAMAAGLTIEAAALPLVSSAFQSAVSHFMPASRMQQVTETDGSLEDVSFGIALVECIESAVWGHGFPAPQFVDHFIVVSQRVLKGKHIKLELKQRRGTQSFEAIWFNQVQKLPERVCLIYRIASNSFNGVTRLQLVITHQVDEDSQKERGSSEVRQV